MRQDGAETFDYIIVGGGTAGCVLANRLSASGTRTVLLLEAGRNARHPWITIPAGFCKLLSNPTYNWQFQTEPEEETGGRVISVPRGKGLGGSTLINGMIYVRGQPQDYNRWAQLGCTGWGFDGVLPYFRRIEDYGGPADPLRARGGPLPIITVVERPAIAEAFIAAGEAGFLAILTTMPPSRTGSATIRSTSAPAAVSAPPMPTSRPRGARGTSRSGRTRTYCA